MAVSAVAAHVGVMRSRVPCLCSSMSRAFASCLSRARVSSLLPRPCVSPRAELLSRRERDDGTGAVPVRCHRAYARQIMRRACAQQGLLSKVKFAAGNRFALAGEHLAAAQSYYDAAAKLSHILGPLRSGLSDAESRWASQQRCEARLAEIVQLCLAGHVCVPHGSGESIRSAHSVLSELSGELEPDHASSLSSASIWTRALKLVRTPLCVSPRLIVADVRQGAHCC